MAAGINLTILILEPAETWGFTEKGDGSCQETAPPMEIRSLRGFLAKGKAIAAGKPRVNELMPSCAVC